MTKRCTKCERELPFTEFPAKKRGANGLSPRCRRCVAEKCAAQRARKNTDPEFVAAQRAYSRAYYQKNKKRLIAMQAISQRTKRHEDPYKRRARRLLRDAVRLGRIIRPNECSECGWQGTPHGHHIDHAKPYEVEWLCSICHGKRHRKP